MGKELTKPVKGECRAFACYQRMSEESYLFGCIDEMACQALKGADQGYCCTENDCNDPKKQL
jgi:hypothetical protein